MSMDSFYWILIVLNIVFSSGSCNTVTHDASTEATHTEQWHVEEKNVTQTTDILSVVENRTADVAMVTDDLAMVTADLIMLTDDFTTITDDLAKMTDDSAMVTHGLAVVTDEYSKDTDYLSMETSDLTMVTDDVITFIDDLAIVTDDLSMVTDDLATATGVLLYSNYTDLVTIGTNNMHLPSTLEDNVFSILFLTISGGGLFGNSIAIVLLNRRNLKKLPCRFLLTALTITDSIYLIVAYPKLFNVNVLYTWVCQALNYAFFFSMYSSKFLIMGISLERFLAICLPIKSKTFLNKRNEVIYCIISALVLVAGISYGPHLVRLAQFQTNDGQIYHCVFSEQGVSYLNNVGVWIEMGVTLIPTVVIIFCTISMIVALVRSSSLTGRVDNRNNVKNNAQSASALLLTVCIAFILLVQPMLIYMMINPEILLNFDTLAYIFMTMELANHAGNCVIYFLSGPMFRKEIQVICLEVCAKLSLRNSNSIEDTEDTGETV